MAFAKEKNDLSDGIIKSNISWFTKAMAIKIEAPEISLKYNDTQAKL